MLLCFDDEQDLATRWAKELGRPLGVIARHRFPDGELRVVLPRPLPSDVLILRGLQHQPNDRLVELLIAAPAARGWGVRHLMLVAPYLAYMRQDMEFTPGEAVSQRHISALLSTQFDRIVTIDPHLHRIASLDEVMPAGRGIALSAAPLLGRFIAAQVPGAVLVGPDEESGQWVRGGARREAGACGRAQGAVRRHAGAVGFPRPGGERPCGGAARRHGVDGADVDRLGA